MRKYLFKIIYWIAETKAWKAFASKWIGYFTFRYFGYTKLADKMGLQFYIYDKMRGLIDEAKEKGEYWIYAFVVIDKESLASKVISMGAKQKFTHAGIFAWVNNGQNLRDFLVLHMKGKGCVRQHYSNQMAQADRFAIVRFKLDNKEEYDEALKRLEFIMKYRRKFKYDYEMKMQSLHNYTNFDPDPDAYSDDFWKKYCSEFVYFYIRGIVEHTRTEIILGRDVYGPDNVYNDGELVLSIP